MTQHAYLKPSAAHRWRHCSGSAYMESLYPELGDGLPAREGRAAHWVLECVLREVSPAEGTMTPEGVEVTRAMLDGAVMTRTDVAATLGPEWPRLICVEQRVAIPRVHEQNWGTPDIRAWTIDPQGRYNGTLHLWDYKFGFDPVEVFENDQLVDYAAGCMSEARIDGMQEQSMRVSLTIIQPRAYHPDGPVRKWAVMASDLRAQINLLAMAAEEACGPAPVCRPRPDVCEHCTARANCDALQTAGYRGMDIARRAVPRELSDEALGLELATLTDVADLLKARMSGLEELVKARLTAGQRVPHWQYGKGRGATKWTKPAAEVKALGAVFGFDLTKPMDVITPIQAKAMGLPESIVGPYSESVSGAVKLERSTDATARKIFNLTR